MVYFARHVLSWKPLWSSFATRHFLSGGNNCGVSGYNQRSDDFERSLIFDNNNNLTSGSQTRCRGQIDAVASLGWQQ